MKVEEIRKLITFQNDDFIGYRFIKDRVPVIPFGETWRLVIYNYSEVKNILKGKVIMSYYINGVILAEDGSIEGKFFITPGIYKYLNTKFQIQRGDILLLRRIRLGKTKLERLFITKDQVKLKVDKKKLAMDHIKHKVDYHELKSLI